MKSKANREKLDLEWLEEQDEKAKHRDWIGAENDGRDGEPL